MGVQCSFFDLEERYVQLSKSGDPLERLAGAVRFEAFRCRLEKALERSDRNSGGRLSCDCALMFKLLILQVLYNLSNEQPEFQNRDRLSFKRFQGLGVSAPVPTPRPSGCSGSCQHRRRRWTSSSLA